MRNVLILFVLNFSAIYAASFYEPIDFSNVVPIHEVPGFFDDKIIFKNLKTPISRNRRIVGGQEAIPHSHPYVCALFMYFNTIRGLCGCSIINQRTVLTAAHCTYSAQRVTVLAGAHNINQVEPTQQRRNEPRESLINHPNYDTQNLNNDIAVIRIVNDGKKIFF